MLETFETNRPDKIFNTVEREGKWIKTITENKYSEQVWYHKGREYHFDFIGKLCTKVQFETLQ